MKHLFTLPLSKNQNETKRSRSSKWARFSDRSSQDFFLETWCKSSTLSGKNLVEFICQNPIGRAVPAQLVSFKPARYQDHGRKNSSVSFLANRSTVKLVSIDPNLNSPQLYCCVTSGVCLGKSVGQFIRRKKRQFFLIQYKPFLFGSLIDFSK